MENKKLSVAQADRQVSWLTVDEQSVGQRVDNFLLRILKGVPKSRVYRALRSGEVRVNKKRVKAEYKLLMGDQVRVPPISVAGSTAPEAPSKGITELLESRILYEDNKLLVLNKPSGLAVHGGSGVNLGLIEALRFLRPQCPHLELVHRIDKETSGCLVLAKKRSVLLDLHEQLRSGQMNKQYLALLEGTWQGKEHVIEAPLRKNILSSGERQVRVSAEGKPSKTIFWVKERFENATLVVAKPVTGRTHQIRVHAQFVGHPILGDERYGVAQVNQQAKKAGLKRLFLHAHSIEFVEPGTDKKRKFEAPLDTDLKAVLKNIRASE